MKYIAIVALLLLVTMPAHAYIDGGSGSYIIQMVMAGVLGLTFSLKLAWRRIRNGVNKFHTAHRH